MHLADVILAYFHIQKGRKQLVCFYDWVLPAHQLVKTVNLIFAKPDTQLMLRMTC